MEMMRVNEKVSEIIKKWEEGKIPAKRLPKLIAEVKGDDDSE